jgi:hypothetical protein
MTFLSTTRTVIEEYVVLSLRNAGLSVTDPDLDRRLDRAGEC